MSMTKSQAKRFLETQRDFIPGGKPVSDPKALSYRKTEEHEVLLCCAQTGYDIQSGPYYCGTISEYVAIIPEGRVSLCARHHSKVMLMR